MSVAAASFVCLLIIFLLNDTVNGSFIRFVCQYPNSDMCLVHHQQLNNFNRFNMEDYPSNYVSFDEDPSNLDNRLEGKEYFDNNLNNCTIDFNFFFILLKLKHSNSHFVTAMLYYDA